MELIISLLPMIVLFGLMYFMLIRPQKKAADQKKQMIEAVKPGDGVVTIGGLHGIVDEVDVERRLVVLDCEGIFLTFELQAVANVKQSVSGQSAVDKLSPDEDNITIVESETPQGDASETNN